MLLKQNERRSPASKFQISSTKIQKGLITDPINKNVTNQLI